MPSASRSLRTRLDALKQGMLQRAADEASQQLLSVEEKTRYIAVRSQFILTQKFENVLRGFGHSKDLEPKAHDVIEWLVAAQEDWPRMQQCEARIAIANAKPSRKAERAIALLERAQREDPTFAKPLARVIAAKRSKLSKGEPWAKRFGADLLPDSARWPSDIPEWRVVLVRDLCRLLPKRVPQPNVTIATLLHLCGDRSINTYQVGVIRRLLPRRRG